MTNIFAPNSMIVPNPYQRRVEYGDISELAQQIATAYEQYPESRGVMQLPRARLVDRTTGEVVALKGFKGLSEGATLPKAYQSGCRIELLYGHRRLEALRWLEEHDERYRDGLAFISLTFATDEQMLDAVWAENAQRKSLSDIEEARLMRDALDALSNGSKYTQSALAQRWGLAQPTVANRLRLLKLPEEVQMANQTGSISGRVALALLDVQRFIDAGYEYESWEDTAEDVMGFAISGKWTSVEIRKWLERRLTGTAVVTEAMLNEEIQMPGVVQATCKRCEFNLRANGEGRCINSKCFDAKNRRSATLRATELARDLCVEYQHDSYIEEEMSNWSRGYKDALLLHTAVSKHFDSVGEHIIITANLDQKYINLPAYVDGKWVQGSGRRYALVATTRLSYRELADLFPEATEGEEETDSDALEIDIEAQPLAKRYEWYKENHPQAIDTAAAGIEAVIVKLTDGLPPPTVRLFCRIVDVPESSDPTVNESRLAEGIYNMWGRNLIPSLVAVRLRIEPSQLDRSHAEAMSIATLGDYIHVSKRLGVMGYEARRFMPQFELCQQYCDHHKIRGEVYADLLVAIQQCDEVLS